MPPKRAEQMKKLSGMHDPRAINTMAVHALPARFHVCTNFVLCAFVVRQGKYGFHKLTKNTEIFGSSRLHQNGCPAWRAEAASSSASKLLPGMGAAQGLSRCFLG
jgi:hypothetical protein